MRRLLPVLGVALTVGLMPGPACQAQPWAILPAQGPEDRREVYALAFSPNGKTLAVAYGDGTVRLWETATAKRRATLRGHTAKVFAVAFSPDGTLLASGSADQTVRLWAVSTARTRATFRHANWVRAVAFSPDGKLLASGVQHGVVELRDLSTRRVKATLRGNVVKAGDDSTFRFPPREHASMNPLAFSPDGKLLASGCFYETLKVWDVPTGKVKAALRGHIDVLCCVAFSPDGTLLASAGWDQTVRLWDVRTGKSRPPLECYPGNFVWSVAFSPDGQLLASAYQSGTFALWDVGTGRLLTVRALSESPFTQPMQAVAFSPDGRLLATGVWDGTVHLWSVPALVKAAK
jgi:WD40 repeat protein